MEEKRMAAKNGMKLARDGTYGDSELKLASRWAHSPEMDGEARFIRRGGASKTARVWEELIFHALVRVGVG
jgi:hypothetical protein